MEDYTCDCDFIKNQKNYYLVLVVNLHYWQKFLSKLYADKFCVLTAPGIFNLMKYLKTMI